ncbi:MAG: aminopeptidase [SAR324 cluster bacterium]|nr:aminopeptidase [SAR324 cluster bacterium]
MSRSVSQLLFLPILNFNSKQSSQYCELPKFWKYFLVLLAGISLAGCSEIQYYLQAIEGHLDILNRKQKIEDLLEAPGTPSDLVRKLKLIQDVRQFAVDRLHLPKIHGYTSYSDIKRPYVVTVVTASQRLQFEPYKWCFLFVGCVSYRGYFNAGDAEEYAEGLKNKAWDVSVGNVRAYSTLNWLNNEFMPDYFKDPVLNTFVDRSDTSIIRLLIHEMAHQVVYVNGDTSFNESFAVFVEQEGLKQYLESLEKGAAKSYQRYLKRYDDQTRFLQIVSSYYEKLEKLYQSDLSETEKLSGKKRLFEEMKKTYQQRIGEFEIIKYDSWFDQDLNNAHLLGIRRYNNHVSSFQKIFRRQDQDWKAFFSKIEEVASFPKEKREAFLQSL